MAKRSDRSSAPRRAGRLALLGLLLLPLLVPAARAQGTYTQTFQLQPGWNAIYLEVQPEPSEIGAAFAGVPIASVWTYDARFGGKVASIADPVRGLLDSTGWYGFFPPGRAEAALTNVFHLRAGRAYLVKLAGMPTDPPVVWQVTGKPLLKPPRWEPDSFNLVGLPVDPQNPPSFGSWFEPSPAHRGQAVYRLDPTGVWQPVIPYFEPIRSGEAYWVWTQGVSEYQGPMEVSLETFDRVEFGTAGQQSTITVRNLHDLNSSVRLRLLASTAPVPLNYQNVDTESARLSWKALPATLAVEAPAGASLRITLAPRRADFASDRVEQVLEIGNGLGSRRLVLMGANTAQSTTPDSFEQAIRGPARFQVDDTPPHPFAGLWVGTATVQKIAEARCVLQPRTGCECLTNNPQAPPDPRDTLECEYDTDGDGEPDERGCPGGAYCRCDPPSCIQTDGQADPTPTGASFDLRLIVHADAGGSPTLLKEVIGLWRPAGTMPYPGDPSYTTVDPDQPGEAVLLTDDTRIHEFEGVVMRDGVPAGVRVATTAYDYDEQTPGWDAATRGLPMQLSGSFGPGAVLSVTLTLRPDAPTHPLRHTYHPDRGSDAPEIVRTMTLTFRSNWGTCGETGTDCDTDAQCAPNLCESPFLGGLIPRPSGWGADTIGGTYRETISGLHRQDLTVEGVFLLTRAATVTTINPPN